MLANAAVALIVLLALLHACSKYLPASWRQQLVLLLVARGVAQERAARWLRTEAGCGSGCNSCKACDAPAPAAPSNGARVITIVRRSGRAS
jgi:hypothetical protein